MACKLNIINKIYNKIPQKTDKNRCSQLNTKKHCSQQKKTKQLKTELSVIIISWEVLQKQDTEHYFLQTASNLALPNKACSKVLVRRPCPRYPCKRSLLTGQGAGLCNISRDQFSWPALHPKQG